MINRYLTKEIQRLLQTNLKTGPDEQLVERAILKFSRQGAIEDYNYNDEHSEAAEAYEANATESEPEVDPEIDEDPLGSVDNESSDFPFRATLEDAGERSYKIMDFQAESKEVIRMLGKKVGKKIEVRNTVLKPDIDTGVLIAQSAKTGELIPIYDPISIMASGAPIFIHGCLTKAAIVIFSQAEEGDLYHEAFHNVEMLYLTPRQRKVMYDWVRGNPGMNNYSDNQASEVLAERFRHMMLQGESAFVIPSDNKFTKALKSIMRFITHYFFNYVPAMQNPNELFNAIYNGHFKYNRAIKSNLKDFKTVYSAQISDGGPKPIYHYEGREFFHIGSSSAIMKIVESMSNTLISREGVDGIKYSSILDLLDQQMKYIEKANWLPMPVEDRIEAIRVLEEIFTNIDLFIDKTKEHIEAKYDVDVENDSIEEEIDEFADVYDYDDGMSASEFGYVEKRHGINSTKVNPSKMASRLVNSILGQLVERTGVDPKTGFQYYASKSSTIVDIPEELGDCQDVESMMKKIAKLKTDPRYLKYRKYTRKGKAKGVERIFTKRFADETNIWSSLESRLMALNDGQKRLFLTFARMYKNEYFTVTEPFRGSYRSMVSPAESFREYGFVRESWNAEFLRDNTITSDVVKSALENFVNLLDDAEAIRDTGYMSKEEALDDLYGRIIGIFKTLGFHSISHDAIKKMVTGFVREKTEELPAINEFQAFRTWFFSEEYRIYNSLKMIYSFIDQKYDELEKEHQFKTKKTKKESLIFSIPMVSPMAKIVAEDLGMNKQVTTIGPNYNRYFVFTKRNSLNDTIEVKLADRQHVQKLKNSAYNKPSLWLNAILKGAKPRLATYLQYVDEDNPTGIDYSKLSAKQNLLAKLMMYASKLLPLPQMGDRPVYYAISGIKKENVGLVSDEFGDISVDKGTVITFMKYFDSELNAIAEAKRAISESILKAIPESDKQRLGLSDASTYESIVRAYENTSANYQQKHPPMGLFERYHYSVVWLNKDGKVAKDGENKVAFKYKFDGKGATSFRYFDFMGTVEAVSKMTEKRKVDLITKYLNDKISEAIELAIRTEVLHVEGYTPGDSLELDTISKAILNKKEFHIGGIRIVSSEIPAEVLKTFELEAKAAELGQGKLFNNVNSVAALMVLADAAINELITGMEFERVVMGDSAFYKSLDDKQARYQMIMTTGDSVMETGRKQYKLFNAASIFDSMDDFISEVRQGYIDMYMDAIERSVGSNTIYNEGLGDVYGDMPADISDDEKDQIAAERIIKHAEFLADNALKDFKNVNKYDGAMLILPHLYQEIYDALGLFSERKKAALEQLMEEGSVDKRYERGLQMQPLKMAYSGIDFINGLSVPVFDKPAIFPLFERNIASKDGSLRRLIDFLSVTGADGMPRYDGIIFQDTTKLGIRPGANVCSENGGFEFNKDVFTEANIENYTLRRNFNDLRLQLYTEHHVKEQRAVGIQIDRQAIDGLRWNDDEFELNGKRVLGSKIFDLWVGAHNELLARQRDEIRKKFGIHEEVPDGQVDAIRTIFDNFIQDRTLSLEDALTVVAKFDETGNIRKAINLNINASTNSTVILNSITGAIGKDVLKIKTAGTDMIQTASLGGMMDWGKEYYQNRFLKFRNKRGNMEIAVGAEFFRHIIPNFKHMSYTEIKQEVLQNPGKYTSFLYRIPSQGVNFSAKVEIVDVMPFELGAIVATPTGWTTASGSDLDSDKAYLAAKYYELVDVPEVVKIKRRMADGTEYIEEKRITRKQIVEVPYDIDRLLNKQDYKAIANMMVDLYSTAASQNANKTLSTQSTDAQTAVVKDYITSNAEKTRKPNMDYLGLNYNVDFHSAVAAANSGLGASALAMSSHVIFTNFYVTSAEGSPNKEFLSQMDLDNFSKRYSNDKIPIVDLLNIMITAFVDALKNPFVFSANITRETLNSTLFGIRAGFGLSTFALMLQPAIKDVSKIGLSQAAANWYMMYQNAIGEEDGESSDVGFDADTIWDDIYSQFVVDETGVISDEFKESMTKREMTKQISVKRQNSETIKKQLMALYLYRVFANEGFALSEATRYHNLYSNSNTSSFHNIIEFQSAVENRLEYIKKRFDGYDQIFDSDFVFKEQLNSINILLKDLEALGLIELSVQSKNIYKAIESYISPYAGTTSRRKVFRDVVRGLKMFYSTEFVNRIMSENGLDVRSLLKLAVNEFINIKDQLTESEISNLLISSIYEQHFAEGDILKFNNMLAKDIWTKNALYASWEDLYNDPKTKKLAELLYLYSVVTQRSSSTGIHDLIAHTPARVINSMYYTDKNGNQVNVDDFYSGINDETISFRDKDVLDFIISVSAGDSDIVQRVGWFKGGNLSSSKRGEPTIGYREFYSPFSPRTPLLISVDVTGESKEAVKVSAGDDALVYHKIGSVRYEKEGRKTNTNPTGKVLGSRDVYILDTQPVVRSIGSINIINLDKNEKIFDTKNPFEVEQLLNEVASKTPNVRDVIFNPSFKIRRDIVNKKSAERASLLGEMRDYTKSMSENYIIVDDSYGEDTVPGRALRSIRDHSGRENSVLIMRKPSLYSAELGSVMIDDLIERFSHGVYFELDPVDSALYQNIQSMKKYGVLIEGTVKSETGVVSKKQDVYSGYTITEIRQKLIEMLESGKKTGYQFKVEELRSPYFANEDFIDEMESETPGEFAAAIENLMKC